MLTVTSRPMRARQRGGVTLLITGVLLSMSAAAVGATLYFLLSGRQALTHRLDREIAFRAAEVALLDAEADVLGAAVDVARGERFDRWPAAGHCGEGAQRGLCVPGAAGAADAAGTAGAAGPDAAAVSPVWQPWLDRRLPADGIGVALGTFTAATLPTMPAGVAGSTTLPRYVVERLAGHATGERVDGAAALARPRLRITALGLGRDPAVRVVLQTIVQP